MVSVLALSSACDGGPPARLLPTGAVVLRELPRRSEQCYVHRSWVLRCSAAEAERWAAASDLPCADAKLPCAHWSTDKRASPFWRGGKGEPNGLDKVDATFASGELSVDFGDYTCSGPN